MQFFNAFLRNFESPARPAQNAELLEMSQEIFSSSFPENICKFVNNFEINVI